VSDWTPVRFLRLSDCEPPVPHRGRYLPRYVPIHVRTSNLKVEAKHERRLLSQHGTKRRQKARWDAPFRRPPSARAGGSDEVDRDTLDRALIVNAISFSTQSPNTVDNVATFVSRLVKRY